MTDSPTGARRLYCVDVEFADGKQGHALIEARDYTDLRAQLAEREDGLRVLSIKSANARERAAWEKHHAPKPEPKVVAPKAGELLAVASALGMVPGALRADARRP